MIKTYSELMRLKTFDERFEYLKLNGKVCNITFGARRYLNQVFYKSELWRSIRRDIIIRDLGCDLGLEGYEIYDKIIVHHINPLKEEDIMKQTEYLTNPEYLISTCLNTHNAIHYSDTSPNLMVERKPGDTRLW